MSEVELGTRPQLDWIVALVMGLPATILHVSPEDLGWLGDALWDEDLRLRITPCVCAEIASKLGSELLCPVDVFFERLWCSIQLVMDVEPASVDYNDPELMHWVQALQKGTSVAPSTSTMHWMI